MSCSSEENQRGHAHICQEQRRLSDGTLRKHDRTSLDPTPGRVGPIGRDSRKIVSRLRGWLTIFAMTFALGVPPSSANPTGLGSGWNCAEQAGADRHVSLDPSISCPVASRAKSRPRAGRRSGRRLVRSEASESAYSATSVPILLVEDSTLFREGLKLILASTQFEVAASAASVEELASVQPADAGGILLLGISGDHAAVVRHVRLAHKYYPSTHCVVLSDHYDPLTVGAVMSAGATAYLLKSNSKAAFVKALEMVMLGSTVLPTAATPVTMRPGAPSEEPRPEAERSIQTDLKADLPHHLSAREIATLYGLKAGNSNKHIAREFAIAEATVKVHVKAILRKIRVANRTQAAIWAMRNLPPRPAGETIDATMAMNGAAASATGDRAGFVIAPALAKTGSSETGLSAARAAV